MDAGVACRPRVGPVAEALVDLAQDPDGDVGESRNRPNRVPAGNRPLPPPSPQDRMQVAEDFRPHQPFDPLVKPEVFPLPFRGSPSGWTH